MDEMDQEDLFVAIRVIGELKPHDKLGIYAGHITIHSSNTLIEKIMTVLKRNMHFESKAVSFEFIKTCVVKLEERIACLMGKQDALALASVKHYLDMLKAGIASQCITYSTDVNMVAKLECQRDKVDVIYKKVVTWIDNHSQDLE